MSSVAFLSNDAIVSAGGQTLLYRPGDVIVWNLADGVEKNKLQGHETTVWSVAVSPDGKLLATASYDGVVKIWDIAEGKLKHDLKKHKNWARSVAFSPDSKKLASGSEDTTVVIWNVDDGKEIKTLTAHAGPVFGVAFLPDNKTLATVGGDKLGKLWDIESGMEKGQARRTRRRRMVDRGEQGWDRFSPPPGSIARSDSGTPRAKNRERLPVTRTG